MTRALDHVTPPTRRPGTRLAVGLLLVVNMFNYIDRYVLAAVEPKLRATYFGGGSQDSLAMAKTGSLATAFIVTYMIAAPLFGWLADRMSRWLLVGVSVLLWSAASGASGLAGTFTILLVTRCFVGIGEAGYGPAAPTIISDLYPIERRGGVLAWFYMAIPVGSALGYAFGGQVVKHLAADPEGWRWAFYLVVPPGLLLGVACLFMRDPPRGGIDAGPHDAAKARWEDYVALLKTPSYALDCAGMAAMTFAIGGISFWMPAYLNEYRQAAGLWGIEPTTFFGAVTVVAGISSTLMGGWAGDALRKYAAGSYFLVSGAAILVSIVFLWLMTRTAFPLAWVYLFIAVFFLFFNTGPSNTILANVTHPALRATAFAFNILVIHALGDVPSPPLLGYIVGPPKTGNWDGAFRLVFATMALGGLLWLWGARYLAADTAAAPTKVRR